MNPFDTIISKSPVLDNIIRSARIAAATDVTILLKGETGTGKEILANAIQQASPRAKGPFVTLNCAALPESLIESSLFGHRRGSFTGATHSTEGIFQTANGGTLFLDEVNSLPIAVQAKLLRVIETGECLAVGETEPYKVDVRIIAASNADIHQQIADGEFRQDLYFRLNVVPLELPPLRQRTEDIDYLVAYFLNLFEKNHTVTAPQFSKQTIKTLKTYRWPGNIRELRNLCERLCILLSGRVIEPENLPPEFSAYKSSLNTSSDFTLPESGLRLDFLEADLIHQALSRTSGNRSKSAKLLGISRDTLLYRMQKHGFAAH